MDAIRRLQGVSLSKILQKGGDEDAHLDDLEEIIKKHNARVLELKENLVKQSTTLERQALEMHKQLGELQLQTIERTKKIESKFDDPITLFGEKQHVEYALNVMDETTAFPMPDSELPLITGDKSQIFSECNSLVVKHTFLDGHSVTHSFDGSPSLEEERNSEIIDEKDENLATQKIRARHGRIMELDFLSLCQFLSEAELLSNVAPNLLLDFSNESWNSEKFHNTIEDNNGRVKGSSKGNFQGMHEKFHAQDFIVVKSLRVEDLEKMEKQVFEQNPQKDFHHGFHLKTSNAIAEVSNSEEKKEKVKFVNSGVDCWYFNAEMEKKTFTYSGIDCWDFNAVKELKKDVYTFWAVRVS